MKPFVLAIVGPTAVGKTQLALSLSQEWPIEIINMDSAQVYQDMNIGTDKPSVLQQKQVKHHVIDLIPPTESFSVASFVMHAKQAIHSIWSRQAIPVLVGGTFLYLKALRTGLHSLPEKSIDMRKKMHQEAQERGWPFLHQKLMAVDPERARTINAHDAQRIQRALEIYEASGQAMTDFFQKTSKAEPLKGIPLVVCGLNAHHRSRIHQKIAARFQKMIEQGFVSEVEHLRRKYALTEEMTSMRCIGYKQAWQYLEGKTGYHDFIETSVAATRQFAKRQLTWMKKTEMDIVLEDEDTEKMKKIIKIIQYDMKNTNNLYDKNTLI